MDPESFSVWGNALRRLPNAFLWLSRGKQQHRPHLSPRPHLPTNTSPAALPPLYIVSVRKDTSMYAQGHLQLEAASSGVRKERLAFSFKV